MNAIRRVGTLLLVSFHTRLERVGGETAAQRWASTVDFPSIPKGIQEPVWLTRQTQRLARLSTRLNRGTRRLLGLTVLR